MGAKLVLDCLILVLFLRGNMEEIYNLRGHNTEDRYHSKSATGKKSMVIAYILKSIKN